MKCHSDVEDEMTKWKGNKMSPPVEHKGPSVDIISSNKTSG